jgi:hypothetical protein
MKHKARSSWLKFTDLPVVEYMGLLFSSVRQILEGISSIILFISDPMTMAIGSERTPGEQRKRFLQKLRLPLSFKVEISIAMTVSCLNCY